MENKYKVELWIGEIEEACKNSKLLNFFAYSDFLQIANTEYLDVFLTLAKGQSLKVANLSFDGKNYHQAIEEYQNSRESYNLSELFTALEKDEQNKMLAKFKKQSEDYYQEKGTMLVYATFGLLDYVDSDNRRETKSAPLVFLPLKIEYTEDQVYQIKSVNNEVYLNETLINYIRQTKKVDISYPINDSFSLKEYLEFVGSRVHMFHFSVNNGCFISTFDMSLQKYYEDVVAMQERISDIPLVKSVSYFNSEFFTFSRPGINKLDKKLLSLLPLDNDEYRILKKVANRESLLIRTDGLTNKTHLLNNIISSFLLNNRKMLIVYDEVKQKEELFANLDGALQQYVADLNEVSINKDVLLSRLTAYEGFQINKNIFDPMSMQEILNRYYDVKNNFKKMINALRKISEPFAISLNTCIEKYYSFDCPFLEVNITPISALTPSVLDEYLDDIRSFEDTLRRLNCNYKDHAFYGFNKKTMMQEEYLPLRDACLNISQYLKILKNVLKHFHAKYEYPLASNLKQTKALLNLFSIADVYRKFPSSFFDSVSWDSSIETLKSIEKDLKSIEEKRNTIVELYGDEVLNFTDELLSRCESDKNLSRKEIKQLLPYFKPDTKISLSVLKDIKNRKEEIIYLQSKVNALKATIDASFENYLVGTSYQWDLLLEAYEAVKMFRNSQSYFVKHRIPFQSQNLEKFKDENDYKGMMAYRQKMQILFNKILTWTETLQTYFNPSIYDFGSLDFDLYLDKTEKMSTNFITINQYLDFYLSLFKMNRLMPGLGNALLKEDDFTLYEAMFCKRFYYDYALYLMNNFESDSFNTDSIMDSLLKYDESDDERQLLFDSFIRNHYLDYLRSNISSLRKYEFNFIEDQKTMKGFRPLSKITYLAHESIFNILPCLVMPLSKVSTLLSSEQYHFDAVIFLSDRKMKTKDTLSALYRSEQTLVFDGQYLTSNPHNDYIDKSEAENFVSAAEKSFETIKFISKTYKVLPLQINKKNIYFKKYLYSYLESEGFQVAYNVPLKSGSVDLLVRIPSRTGYTALIIDRLPYYSLESAKETFEKEDLELKELGYSYIRIFPFAFFKNEEKEKENLKNIIVENSFKAPIKKPKYVQKKITDVLFRSYKTPIEVYYAYKNKKNLPKENLFFNVLSLVAPVLKEQMIQIFPQDGNACISNLIKQEKIYEKNGFLYVFDQPIEFRSYKNKGTRRLVTSVSSEEIKDGILRLVSYLKSSSEDAIIHMILISLGYTKMNATTYQHVDNEIIELVKEEKLVLHEGVLSVINNDTKDDEEDVLSLVSRETI